MHPRLVAVGDGALGFWAAVRDVWPKTRERRDWFHKFGNILDKLPKRLQPRVKAALHEVMHAETCEQAREAVKRFAADYGAKYPKTVVSLEKDADMLLTFFDSPAEHWAAAAACDEGRGVAHEGPPDGLQAPRHGAGPVTPAPWRTPPAARPSRYRLRGRIAIGGQSQQGESESGVIMPLRPRSRTSRSTLAYRSSSSRAFASCRSRVSKPSVNQEWTRARRTRA
jgi:Transposase, Mutator family